MTTKTLTLGPKIKTALPGPNARRILAGDEKYISPSYTRSYPMVAKRGRGIVVEDVDGNEFFDFSAGIAVTSTGHCHPDVVAAIQKQAGELIHMSGTDFYYESMVTLAERLSKIAPMAGPHRIYYGNSGAEAIECALKLSRYHTKRQQVIAFLGAFHGRTMGALSLTASKPQQKRRFAPLVPGVTHVRYPDIYRGCVGGPQNAEEFAIGCARYIEEKLFKTVLAPEEVAAIFVEAIQGEGGYVVAPTVFMQELRRICDKHGILLVLDEVQSGIGRTGKWFAVEHTGVQPDIVCMAKGIASGMPLGVTMSKAEIMDWVPGSHASTFGGNPVCIAAALATLDVIEKEGLVRNAQEVGEHMMKRMAEWPKKHRIVGDVRGRGLMIGVDMVKDQKTREYGAVERDRVVETAFERGVLFLGCGPSTVRIAPPLVVTKDEADVAMDVLEESIAVVEKSL
ncbi:MAG: acetyl ornithine aminotransferase family protein [Terriglobales bacterium]